MFVRTAWLVYVVDPTHPWKCWILQCKTYGGLLLSSKAKIKLCHQCNIDMFMSTCWRATKSKSHFNVHVVISHIIIRMLININKSHVNITNVACWQYLSCMLVTEMCHHKNVLKFKHVHGHILMCQILRWNKIGYIKISLIQMVLRQKNNDFLYH